MRLQTAPTVGLVWHRAGSDRVHARAILEATPHLWGRASPTAGCVGYCQPVGFVLLTAALGADLVLAPGQGPTVPSYLALGARARAHLLASAACPLAPGAFCPGKDPLTGPAVHPALAVAAGMQPRLGARRLSIEVGYLPAWIRSGRMQHHLRVALGTQL